MNSFFSDIRNFSEYIYWSAKANLRAEVVGSRLGWIWWILEPALNMLVYFFVFSVVFHRSGLYPIAYIYIGLILWRFFTTTVKVSVGLVKREQKIISKVYIPKPVFLIRDMIVNIYKLLLSCIFIIPLMFYYHIPLSFKAFAVIPQLICWLTFTFGFSCICMNAGVFFEDLKKLLDVIFRIVFYISGVFYSIRDLFPGLKATVTLLCNPVAFLLGSVRDSLIYSQACNWHVLLSWFMISVALCIIGLCQIYSHENQYIKVI